MEQTFALIKSNAIERGETSAILKAIKEGGFKIVAARAMAAPCDAKMPEHAQYEALLTPYLDDPTYNAMLYSLTHPVGATMLVVETADGTPGAVARFLHFLGDPDPSKAAPGTLRQRFGTNPRDNAVHGSLTPEAARREIAIGFPGAPPPSISYALPARPEMVKTLQKAEIASPDNETSMVETVVVESQTVPTHDEVRVPMHDDVSAPVALLSQDSATALPGWTKSTLPPPRRRPR